MSDVLFVVPARIKKVFEECEGTILLSTILRKSGIDVDIHRFYEADLTRSFNGFVQETVEIICAKKPRIVSFYCRCDCFLANIKIAESLKKINKDIHIVFGGPQATASCRETIEELPFVDFCCSGEGETTVVPLFDGILKGEDVSHIPGLTYRNEAGEVISNPVPALMANLDDLPYIDYDLVPPEIMRLAAESDRAVAIDAGRGCPFNCAYCSTNLFWNRKFRVKSPARIVSEMKRVNEKYNIKKFVFEHDLFTANKKNILAFCKELKESKIKVRWTCSSRIDTIDEEMIDAMVDANCTEIYFGVETGSPRMQEIIHKRIKIDDVIRICRYLVSKNIRINASFMYGFPEETQEDLEQTMKLVLELLRIGVKNFQFHLCTILPGTEYFDKYKSELVFAQGMSNFVTDFGVEENYDFICEHKRLFSFYYEYHNEHRERFSDFGKFVLPVISLYKRCADIDPQRFADMKLTDMYFEYINANSDTPDFLSGFDEKQHAPMFAKKFLASVYCGDELNKICEIYDYLSDCVHMYNLEEGAMDVKTYSVDIKAYTQKKSFSEISLNPSVVYFRKKNGKVEIVVNKM